MAGRASPVTIRSEGDVRVLVFSAHLTADVEESLSPLLDDVLATPPRLLVADLSPVTLSNTAGLGTLVGLVRRAREAGVPVVFAGATGRTRVLMERLKMNRYARMTDTVDDALRIGAP